MAAQIGYATIVTRAVSVLRGSKLMLEEVEAFLTLGGAEEGWAEGNTHAIRPRWEKSTLLRGLPHQIRALTVKKMCAAERLYLEEKQHVGRIQMWSALQ